MTQVDVQITFEGKRYLTNVLITGNISNEEILRLAYEQVEKQWKK